MKRLPVPPRYFAMCVIVLVVGVTHIEGQDATLGSHADLEATIDSFVQSELSSAALLALKPLLSKLDPVSQDGVVRALREVAGAARLRAAFVEPSKADRLAHANVQELCSRFEEEERLRSEEIRLCMKLQARQTDPRESTPNPRDLSGMDRVIEEEIESIGKEWRKKVEAGAVILTSPKPLDLRSSPPSTPQDAVRALCEATVAVTPPHLYRSLELEAARRFSLNLSNNVTTGVFDPKAGGGLAEMAAAGGGKPVEPSYGGISSVPSRAARELLERVREEQERKAKDAKKDTPP